MDVVISAEEPREIKQSGADRATMDHYSSQTETGSSNACRYETNAVLNPELCY